MCEAKLAQYMPELVPIHRELVELAGGDEVDARMLSLYDPPPFITGCSQAAWVRGTPVLIRNYDYPISRLEGVLVQTAWSGRRVIGMSDCLWGLLDGVNDDGLAVSLTFGGRAASGEGFAIPLVVRYVLETCTSVREACAVLARVPVHASQNVTLVDRTGDYMTAYVAPDRPLRLVKTAVTTNHQGIVEWPEYEQVVQSVNRESCLLKLIADPTMTAERLQAAFLEPPIHSSGYRSGTGTLYTASYYPGRRARRNALAERRALDRELRRVRRPRAHRDLRSTDRRRSGRVRGRSGPRQTPLTAAGKAIGVWGPGSIGVPVYLAFIWVIQ